MSAPPAINPTASPTPILDRLAPLPTRPKRTVKATLLQMIVGAAIGAVLAFALISRPDWFEAGSPGKHPGGMAPPLLLLVIIFYIYANLYLGIIIHEAGHLLAGVLSGYRVNFMRVGPIQINPPFQVSRQPKLGTGAAGMASLFPGKNRNVHANAVFMLLGGPLANIISAGCVLLLLPKPLSTFPAWFVSVSLLLGIGNLIPFVRMGAVSDGCRILMTLRKTPQGERWLAIMQICTALWDGVLPENLDPELLKNSTALVDNWPDTAGGYVLAFSAAFHQHNDAEAARFLETALQHSRFTTLAGRESLVVEAAIFQAKRRGRIDIAEQWLNDVPQKTLTPGLRCLGEAAILEARNETAAALTKLNESEQAISGMPAGFQRDVLLSSLARRKSEISSQLAAAPVVG